MKLRAKQFQALITEKIVEDGSAKIPLFEYEEEGHSHQYAIMEATLFGERGTIGVRMHHGVHFTYIKGELVVKSDRRQYQETFKASLYSFDVAYVTKETYDKYLEEVKNPYFRMKDCNDR